MAIQKKYNYKGIELENAYLVITNAEYSKFENIVSFNLSIYANQETREQTPVYSLGSELHDFYPTGSYDIISNNIIESCYNYLKTQNEYSSSIEV